MKQEGLKIRDVVTSKTENGLIFTYENKVFEPKEIQEYIDKFNKIKNEVSIIGDFFDNIWLVKTLTREVRYDFPFEFNKNLNNALKAFFILEIYDNKKSFHTMYSTMRKLNSMIEWTALFSKDHFDILEEELEDVSNHYKSGMYSLIVSFLSFFHINDFEFYIEELSNFNVKKEQKNRLLPDYRSILIFDSVLEDFLLHSSEKEMERFYPLVLWWKITRILPLRPIEFSLIKQDCLHYIEEEDKYYLTVPRCKINSYIDKKLNVEKFDRLQITKDIFDLIRVYQKMTGIMGEYLLSYEHYSQFAKNKAAQKRKYNPNLLWSSEMRHLLDTFYKDVIHERYGYNVVKKGENHTLSNAVEMIQLGDTRHFAFCSMMLQGFSPLTIARLGGHSNIHTQMSYHAHLETFAEANVKVLAERMKKTLNNSVNDFSVYNTVFNSREALVQNMVLQKQSNTSQEKREIEGGYCLSSNFPYECPPNTDCIFCPMFLLNLDDRKTSENKTKALSDKVSLELTKQISLLKELFSKNNVQKENEKEIKNTSETLSRIIGQKSVIEAYQLKLKEIDSHGKK